MYYQEPVTIEQEHRSQPKTLGEIFEKLEKEKKTKPVASEDKAKHERAYWVELTRKALGDHWKTKKPYTFGVVNGLTRKWPIAKIRDRYLYCQKQNGEFSFIWFGMRKQDKQKTAA